ncbi:MAG: DUF3617 domain-containing protein [Betaproteobacteria bacterium]
MIRIMASLLAAALLSSGALAQAQLEPGNWELTLRSTTNGKADPVQNSEECLGDELKDLGAYFAPSLEGTQAKCERTRQASSDPRQINYRMRCTAPGLSVNAATGVTVVNPRLFTLAMRIESRTPRESALVTASAEGRRTGACKGK